MNEADFGKIIKIVRKIADIKFVNNKVLLIIWVSRAKKIKKCSLSNDLIAIQRKQNLLSKP